MVDRIHGISGITPFASMPQASLDFPNSVCLNVETIDKIFANALLSVVPGVANDNVITFRNPSQHLQGDDRLFVFRLVSTRRNDGDGVLLEERFTEDEITSRGNGETRGERVDICDLAEKFAELETAATQNVHIGLTVSQNFSLKVELVLTLDLVVVPCIKLFAVIAAHAIRIVELGFRHWSHVILVLSTVKEMRKVTFLKLCETKRFREGGEFHWDEAKGIDEFNVHFGDSERKDFCATSNNLRCDTVLVEVLQNEVPVVGLKIMCDKRCIGVFLLKHPLAKLVFSVWARKDFLVTAFVLDYAQIGDVFTIVLRALKVEEHQVFSVFHVIIHGHIVIEQIVFFFRWSCLLRLHRLKITLMVFRLDVLLTGGTSHFATMMITKTGTSNNTFAFLAFHQSTTQGFGRTGVIFMAVEAFVTFKETVTVFAKFPFNDRTVLGITQFAQVATGMVSNLVVALFASMAILFTGEEGRHTGDDVVMVVVVVQV